MGRPIFSYSWHGMLFIGIVMQKRIPSRSKIEWKISYFQFLQYRHILLKSFLLTFFTHLKTNAHILHGDISESFGEDNKISWRFFVILKIFWLFFTASAYVIVFEHFGHSPSIGISWELSERRNSRAKHSEWNDEKQAWSGQSTLSAKEMVSLQSWHIFWSSAIEGNDLAAFDLVALTCPQTIRVWDGGSSSAGNSVRYSSFNHLTVNGNRFQGPDRNMWAKMRIRKSNCFSLVRFFKFKAFNRRESVGCCHAHSKRNAEIWFGKPCTMTIISQGPRLLVLQAPPPFFPALCCRILRFGSTVKPIYVRPQTRGCSFRLTNR